MNKNYESPSVETIIIKIEDIMLESNELPEIDLNGLNTQK